MNLEIFLSGWWTAVRLHHNKTMEMFNNPTPEVVHAESIYKERLLKIGNWAVRRWGHDTVKKAIYFKQFGSALK